MNLAEIRKKAGEANKPDKGSPLVPAAGNPAAQDDAAAVWTAGLPAATAACEDSYDFALDDENAAMPPAEYAFQAAETVALEELLPAPVEEKPTTPFVPAVEPVAEVLSAADLPVSASAGSSFDPLAALLAGRASGAEGEDASFGAVQAQTAGEIEEYLCFRVADEEYALSIMAIKEIIKPRDVTEVPRMPAFISGVISLRGLIIPVMDMRLRLALSVGAGTGRERVIVLRTDAGFCGVLVDEVIQVVRMQRSEIEDPPAVLDGIDREFVKGLGRVDNRMLILLNLESILDLGIH